MQPVAHGLTWNRSRVRRLRRIVALLACTAVLGACVVAIRTPGTDRRTAAARPRA